MILLYKNYAKYHSASLGWNFKSLKVINLKRLNQQTAKQECLQSGEEILTQCNFECLALF